MKLEFSKMHGAGNDFIVAMDSPGSLPLTPAFIRAVCDRRKGVGADGLIVLARSGACARMSYFNADGSPASLCGNGLRCAAEFARAKGLSTGPDLDFETDSGRLATRVVSPGMVRIQMPVSEPFKETELDCEWKVFKGAVGVPHAVIPVPVVDRIDVKAQGRRFRFHPAFSPEGANVDFVQIPRDFSLPVRIRTYERGVEAETLACGTGATSVAICMRLFFGAPDLMDVLCAGGDLLRIELICKDNIVVNAHLTGPARTSFSGTLETSDFPA